MNAFSMKLRQYRLMRGLTQKDMALILNMTPNAYQKYELGTREPKLEVLIKIADAFGITLDELVGRIPPEFPLMDFK